MWELIKHWLESINSFEMFCTRGSAHRNSLSLMVARWVLFPSPRIRMPFKLGANLYFMLVQRSWQLGVPVISDPLEIMRHFQLLKGDQLLWIMWHCSTTFDTCHLIRFSCERSCAEGVACGKCGTYIIIRVTLRCRNSQSLILPVSWSSLNVREKVLSLACFEMPLV